MCIYKISYSAERSREISAVFTSVFVIFFVKIIIFDNDSLAAKFALALLAAFLSYVAVSSVRSPNGIEISSNKHSLRFFSKYYSKEYKIENLKSIENLNEKLTFRFSENESIAIETEIDNLHELITKLKEINSGLHILGC